MFPFGETVTLRTTTNTDDDLGNSTSVEVESEWGPVAVWDRFADERTDPSVAPVVVGLMIAGPRVDIGAADTIVRGGVVYEVDGEPEANTINPFTGWDPGIVVPVKRASGR